MPALSTPSPMQMLNSVSVPDQPGRLIPSSPSRGASVRWVCTTPDQPWRELDPLPGSPSGPRPTAVPDLVVTGRTDQTWRGFGGCFNELGGRALEVLSASVREGILADLFSPEGACRFNLARLPIGANDYAESWYSHDEYEDDVELARFSIERDRRLLLPFVKAAQRHRPDLRIFASPWSPPTWMKTPAACNFGVLRPERAIREAYARYFLRFVKAYAAEGIPVSEVHVQNEPDSDQKFPSCVWTGESMRDFIRDHLGPLFEREAPGCEVWAGTIEREDYSAWAHIILSDPEARRHVRGVGYQWAGRGAVQRTHQAWPDLPISQTENECGDGKNNWDYAFRVFDLLQHYVTNGASAYYYWNMVLAPEGRSTWGWKQNAMITVDPATRAVTLNPEYHVMRHASRFIRPGAVRLEVAGPIAAHTLAFRDPDGSRVLVLANPLPVARTVVFDLPGFARSVELPARSLHSFVISSA